MLSTPVVASKSIVAEERTVTENPYVDALEYKVTPSESSLIDALKNSDIDMIGETINASYVPELKSDPKITVSKALRNGYGYFIINCAKYPYNYTAFRRAIAFAVDKWRIADEVWDGNAVPLDSVIPKISPWSAEGQLPFS